MTGAPSAAADLERVEACLLRLLELLGEPGAEEARLRDAWQRCAGAFAVLPTSAALGRLAATHATIAERLRSVVRLNGLALAGAQRQGALASGALDRLRTQRDGFALWRREGAGGSCDVTG